MQLAVLDKGTRQRAVVYRFLPIRVAQQPDLMEGVVQLFITVLAFDVEIESKSPAE